MTIRISSMLLLPVLVLALADFRGLQASEIRAAVVKVDITPDSPQMLRGYSPRMSTKVHDRLYHRIVALDDGTEMLQVPLRFLRINDDTILWSAPMELFCEISNEIRDRSPFANTFYVGYTNGTFC